MKHLVLGGTRSGKSRWAECWALQREKSLCYIATAEAGDEEMATRIAHHRNARDACWVLHEEPLALAATLTHIDAADTCILVDCLTLWLSNCLAAGVWEIQGEALLSLLPSLQADVVLVSNEVGQGIVPLGKLNRQFVDESGRLHQQLAASCEQVTLVTAGLPQRLKGAGH